MSFLKNKIFSRLYVEDKKVLIVIIMMSLVMSSVLGIFLPRTINSLFNSYDNTQLYYQYMKSLGTIFVFEYLNRIFYQFSINKYVQHLLMKVRLECYQNWILSYETTIEGEKQKDRYPLGEVLARIMSDTESVKELVTSGSFSIFIDVIFIISCLISFISLNTTSGIALILAEVTACIGLVYGSKFIVKVFMDTRKASAKVSRTLANISGGFAQGFYIDHKNYASKRASVDFSDFLKKQLNANIWDASYFSVAESLYPILLVILVLVFPYSNIVEVGIFAAIIDLIQRSISPIKDIAGKISTIQRARTGIIRIDEFNDDLETMPSSLLETSHQILDVEKVQLNINSFSYQESEFNLKDISIEAVKGEMIGIVGLSGCGKSTVLKILAGNILTRNARVKLSSKSENFIMDVDDLSSVTRFKAHVGIVSQDSHIFTDTLEFNISMGMKGSEDFKNFFERISLQIPYLKKWGVGPSSKLTPSELSLGQKQLVSALRACYLKKPIILFDEISSSLDSEVELALRKLVLLINQDSIAFTVAHRLETVVNSNNIYVLDDGRLKSSGKHLELMESSEIYRSFIAELNSAN